MVETSGAPRSWYYTIPVPFIDKINLKLIS